MTSALDLLGESSPSSVQKEGIKATSALDLLQPVQAERFPTTPDAMNALTLEGELGLGKAKDSNIVPFDVTVPEGVDPTVMAEGIVKNGVAAAKPDANSEAIRRYYEYGLDKNPLNNPSMLMLTPMMAINTKEAGVGGIDNTKFPEPPGGYDKQGKPLDENGKPYNVPSMSEDIGKIISATSRHTYAKINAVAESLAVKASDIGSDLLKAYDNATKDHPALVVMNKELNNLIEVGQTAMGFITPLVAWPLAKYIGGLVGAYAWSSGDKSSGDAAENAYQDAMQQMTELYQPKPGSKGEAAAMPVGKLFEALAGFGKESGDIVAESWKADPNGMTRKILQTIGELGAFEVGGKVGKAGVARAKGIVEGISKGLTAKNIEGSLEYTPSVVPPEIPYTGTEFKHVIPSIVTGGNVVTSGNVKTNISAQELLEPLTVKDPFQVIVDKTMADISQGKERKIKPEVVKDPLQAMVEKAQGKIDEINKTQADLEAAKKAVKETPVEEVIAEELKVKGEKVQEIREGKVDETDQKLMELKDEEGIDIAALEEAFPEPKLETVTGVAAITKDGKIISREGGVHLDLYNKMTNAERGNVDRWGFVTDQGRFLTNEEAAKLVPEDKQVPSPNRRGEVVGKAEDVIGKELDPLKINETKVDLASEKAKVDERIKVLEEMNKGIEKDNIEMEALKAEVEQAVTGKPKRKVVRKKKEPVTELDEQLGEPTPELLQPSNPKHPFRDSRVEYTNTMSKMFKEKLQGAGRSIEVYTRYAINEVNRYLNGEDVNIEKVREVLSDLSSKAEDVRNQFDRTDDFIAWQRTVGEAAKWARGTDRLKINGTGGTRLNMMIPVDQIPGMVKDVLKDIKATVGDVLHRNKDIFDKTGYWLGKDGKWRYELGPEDVKPISRETKLHAQTGGISRGKLPAYLGESKLFKDVPGLRDVNVVLDRNLKDQNRSGYYEPSNKTIYVGEDWQGTFTHELQHAINDIVGSKFKGTNPEHEYLQQYMNALVEMEKVVKDPEIKAEINQALRNVPETQVAKRKVLQKIMAKADETRPDSGYYEMERVLEKHFNESATDVYMKDPGEMEARLASKRMEMSEKERKAEPPWETLDKMLESEGWTSGFGPGMTPIKSSHSGHTLYMGIDPTQIPEATRKIIEGAKKLAAYTNKARGMKEWKPAAAAKMLREEFNRSFVDRSGNIRQKLLNELGNQGYEIIQKMYLSKGASSLAAQQLKQMRGEVYDGLNRTERRVLDNLILADRMLDIGKYKTAKEFKFPEGLSPIEAAAYNELFQFTEKLTGEQASLLRDRAKAYFDWMKKPLKDMLDAELISEQEFNDLSSHNYRRIKLVDVFDKRSVSKTGKTKRTVYDSGVEALSRGRDTDIFEPSSEVMALEVFNRAYGRILNNGANRTLLDLARQDRTNPFVRVKETPKDGIPTGWDRVFVYEKGERKALYLSPEMSKEWITNSPEMSYKMSQFLRYASGSPVLRTFATGINWAFALRNLPRDIMHIWYAARTFQDGKWNPVYSSHMPVYGLQMGRDLGNVFLDAVLRKGRYQDYIKEGGGMEFLVHQGRLMQRGRHIEGGLDKVQDFLGYFGETSEIMTRLAIRERVLRQGKSPQEATFAARDYMDFGQGGGLGKALDNAFPYLNASIIGTRGLLRAFKDNPLQSTYKTAQFAALVTGLYIYNNNRNPETMKSLKGNIDMQNNLVIPLGDGFSYLDEKGQTRYPYVKIPLDPGQRFFKTFFEASTDKWLGNQIDVDAVTNTMSQISPVGISSLPPTVSGALGYMYNKDFWKNEDIWKKTDKPFGWPQSKQEYIPGQTPQAMVDLGSATGLSPERTKHAIEQLITSGSEWAWLSGYGYDKIFGSLTKDQKEQHLAEVLSKMPIIKGFIGVTNPYSQFASPIEKAREDSSLQRWTENRGLDTLVDGYLYQKNTKESEITDYIAKSRDKDTADRLKERYKFSVKIKDLENRSFWLALKGTPDTEARARLYVERYDNSTPSQREKLDQEVGVINQAGGVISDEFKKEVGRLRSIKN